MTYTTRRRLAWIAFALSSVADLIALRVIVAALVSSEWLWSEWLWIAFWLFQMVGNLFMGAVSIWMIREYRLMAQIERTGDSATDTNTNE
jgi:hypothetical protein